MSLYELVLLLRNKVTSRAKRHSMRNEIKLRVIFTTTFARVLSYTCSAKKKGIYNKELGHVI